MAVPDYNTSLPFAANLYIEIKVIGIMNVRIYPEQEVSQNEIKISVHLKIFLIQN